MTGKKQTFRGSMVAMVTPFKNGRLDEAAFARLIERQIENGTDAVVPCGTTGESATLSHEEHKRVIEHCVEVVAGRVPVIAGSGSNATEEAVMLTQHAQKAGATAALLISPYYNKPTQEGLFRHFKTIADRTDLPLVLYNIPGRTGVNLLPKTIARLSDHPNIAAVKESSGSLQQITELIHLCGDRVDVLSGDDVLTLPIMSVGGKGVISVTANVAPGEVSRMVDAMAQGKGEEACAHHHRLFPLTEALFLETNPIPVKTALSLMGLCSPELRLPLYSMSAENLTALQHVLKSYGLL